jgi:PAS domain S-box-containing protein
MKNFVGTLKENNFLKNKLLRRIFILSVLVTIGMPLSYLLLIHPSVEKLIIMDKEEDALSIARHLSSLVPIKNNKLTRSNVQADLLNEMIKHNDHFGLIKINIYSNAREMIFSTDKSYTDYVHNDNFFQELLTKGSVYTKFTAKGDMITGGKILPFDMIQTYVPLRNGNIIVGVFEIYYDITERTAQLHNLALRSCILLLSFAFTLLIIITLVLINKHRSIIKCRQAEDESQSQLQFSQQLIDNIPSPIFYKDVQGIYLGCNSALEQFLGLSKHEIVGKTVHDLATKEWADIHWETDLALLKEPGTRAYVTIAEAGGGKMHDFIVHKATYKDISGAAAGLVGVLTDITEFKQTEEARRASENKLQMLSSHLLTIQERERRRISFELHDELGQSLTFLKLQIGSIGKKLRKDQGVVKEEVESTQDYVDQVLESIRRLSRELSPSTLEDLGLYAALRSMAEDFATHSGIETSIDMAEEVDDIFLRQSQIHVYRIFQESLTNISKHAEARHVSLAVEMGENEFTLAVEDDGRGFDTREVAAKYSIETGLGLTAMGERARMLEGSLEISSRKGEGTRVTVIIPIENSS